MEATRTKNNTEVLVQYFIDTLVYYMNPGEWLLDFDCLFITPEPKEKDKVGQVFEQKYLHRLLLTIFMPLILFITNVVVIWFLTFLVKQCQFRKREDMRPLNCTRLFNRVSIAFGIQMFLIYPPILFLLFASTECFESLDPSVAGSVIERMLLVPDISCDSDFYTQVYWAAIVPSLFVYCGLVPLFTMRQAIMSSHWIFHSNRDRKLQNDEEQIGVSHTKSHFGFYFVGFSTGRLLLRKITDKDFPIENNGTFSAKNLRSPFKECGQGCRERLLTCLVYPLMARGVLVRISPEHINKSFFYWELVLWFEKIAMLSLATRFAQQFADSQLIFAFILLSIFLALQVRNKPYFSSRTNQLRQVSILASIGYCVCRVIINGLGQIYYGGQVDPLVELNVVIPRELYEYTRTYINLNSNMSQGSIMVVFVIMLMILGATFLYWLYIIHFHFLLYLAQEEEKARLVRGLESQNKTELIRAQKLTSEKDKKILSKQGNEEDCLKCLRWNHASCLVCCANCCQKDKLTYDEFKAGPFEDYVTFLSEQCDPQYDFDLQQERAALAQAAKRLGKKKKKKSALRDGEGGAEEATSRNKPTLIEIQLVDAPSGAAPSLGRQPAGAGAAGQQPSTSKLRRKKKGQRKSRSKNKKSVFASEKTISNQQRQQIQKEESDAGGKLIKP